MDPSIGPTQGVQPKAKEAPSADELRGFPFFILKGKFTFLSTPRKEFIKGIFRIPVIYKPKNITNAPPMRVSHMFQGASDWPRSPAIVPKPTKITVTPSMKKRPFKKILRRALPARAGSFSSPAEVPLIQPKYAGARGSVKGARNVIIPAIKAGIISAITSGDIVFVR